MVDFIFNAGALDVGKVVTTAERIVEMDEGDGGNKNVYNSEEIVGKVFGVHIHYFGGGDDVER